MLNKHEISLLLQGLGSLRYTEEQGKTYCNTKADQEEYERKIEEINKLIVKLSEQL